MTWAISKDFTFSASHRLDGLREGHQCGRMHGHNYVIRVELVSDAIDEHGFVLDYGDLAPFGAWLDEACDHRHLNDVFPGIQTSSENLARMMTARVRHLVPVPFGARVNVHVSETPKSWCVWRET